MASQVQASNLVEKDSAVPESPAAEQPATTNRGSGRPSTNGGKKKKKSKKSYDLPKNPKRRTKTKKDLNQNEMTPEQISIEKQKTKRRQAIPHFVKGSIRRIVKDIQPDYTVSARTAQVCSDLAVDFMHQLIGEENMLLTHNVNNKSKALSLRSAECAFKLKATGEIVNHGVSEARKAVNIYKEWKAPPEPKEGEKKKQYTWRKKCGLIIDPIWCRKLTKQSSKANTITKENSIAKAAVTEYMLAEVLELAANHLSETTNNKTKRIKPRNVQMAILNDEELYRMFGKVNIAAGGTVEHIHQNLRENNVKQKDMVAAVY